MRGAAAVLSLATIAGCGDAPAAFECPGTPACRNGAELGICEESGYCSFADPACANGRRYGAAAGDGLAGACVELGLDPVGAWSEGPALPMGRYTLATTLLDHRLYAMGGIAGSTPYADVWYSDVSGGSVRGWAQTGPLPGNIRNTDAVAYDGFVYLAGGRNETSGNSLSTEVLAAPVNADGSVGPFAPTTPLPGGLRAHEMVQWNQFAFVVGGKVENQNGEATSDVLVGEMTAGTIASWRLAGSFEGPRHLLGAALVGDYLYVIGGCGLGQNGCVDVRSDVQVARIEADGTLGPFAYTTPLPAGVWHHTATGTLGHVVVLGGDWADGRSLATVLVNHVNSDGSLGAWRATGELVTGIRRSRAEVDGQSIFVIGQRTQTAMLRD